MKDYGNDIPHYIMSLLKIDIGDHPSIKQKPETFTITSCSFPKKYEFQ